jgi:hypothetical protein
MLKRSHKPVDRLAQLGGELGVLVDGDMNGDLARTWGPDDPVRIL